ncbi:DMT family transporter [Abyssisolibacter fermentans]|uniref:DMT family transporter n=1 Tax=Abyssisolibacter fermentans TaxID=1766203 RepID=UPI000832FA85|nr:DMT family transporter [Abyssisolibacter fermentans]
MKKKFKSIYADIALVFVAVCWGAGFVVLKDALDNISPFNIMAIRFTLAFVIMALIFNKKLRNLSKQDLKAGFIIGVFLFLGFAVQTVGLKYTVPGKQAFLTGTNVVIVPFFVWLIHKKAPDKYSIAGAFMTLIGISLLTLKSELGGFDINYGDKLTLLCAVFFAAHIVAVGFFTKKHDPIVLAVLQIGVAALLFIICALMFEELPRGIESSVWLRIGYLVLFPTVVAFLIQNVAQKSTTSTRTGIILSLESVFGALFAVIIYKEEFTIKMILGCLLIFCAIIITETKLSFLKNKKA